MAEFLELNDENFTQTLNNTPLALVDFYASWCGSCRMAAPMFKRVAGEKNLPIFKIDAEKNPNARSHVSIENLPTLALWKNGTFLGVVCTTKEEGLKEFLATHGL
jgi:thioredoxin 1